LFTLCLAAGASAEEAAEIANHAAGVVVGKLGTATLTPAELLASFDAHA
jgi:D-beta-D-heptose 7-phosphate kinase/D-beta-D-heptose 1-phosphate adenosyltransferase